MVINNKMGVLFMTIDSMTVKEIIALRKQGCSYNELRDYFSISKATAHKYGSSVELDSKVKQYLLERSNNFPKKINLPEKMSGSFARVLGHTLFDGCVSNTTVSYVNSSKTAVEQHIKDVKAVFGLNSSKICAKKKEYTEYYVVDFYSLNLVKFLKKFSKSFSTSSREAIVPKEIFESSEDIICEYLQTFWDDEGAVKSVSREVTGKTKSKRVAEDLIKLHSKVGIDIRLYYDTCNDAYELYVSRANEGLKKFKQKIGFKYGRVSRGHFRGLSKKQALELVI
jgi:hypothetical protein